MKLDLLEEIHIFTKKNVKLKLNLKEEIIMNNTFEDVKKIKWLMELLAQDTKENQVKFASMKLEENECMEVHKAITNVIDFSNLTLFIANICNENFQIQILVKENDCGIVIMKIGDENFDAVKDTWCETKDEFRKKLNIIHDVLVKDFTTLEEAYEKLITHLFV